MHLAQRARHADPQSALAVALPLAPSFRRCQALRLTSRFIDTIVIALKYYFPAVSRKN
jgi:hypothetical protein